MIEKHEYRDQLPDYMREPARLYLEEGKPPGDFMYALLTNDLRGAITRADAANTAMLSTIWMWWLSEIPSAAQGSPYNVEAWVEHEGLLHKDTPNFNALIPGLKVVWGQADIAEYWDTDDDGKTAIRDDIEQIDLPNVRAEWNWYMGANAACGYLEGTVVEKDGVALEYDDAVKLGY